MGRGGWSLFGVERAKGNDEVPSCCGKKGRVHGTHGMVEEGCRVSELVL